jgi:hypothetical protein
MSMLDSLPIGSDAPPLIAKHQSTRTNAVGCNFSGGEEK